MKRFHVHVAVNNLEQSARFYSAMFGAAPTVQKPDYAKWMLDDPRINFAISERANAAGLNHLGFQADSDEELQEIHARLQHADTAITAEVGANCCYAKSDKYWVQDPSGIAWESFRSLGTIPFYGEDDDVSGQAPAATKELGCAPSCSPIPETTAVTTTATTANPATETVKAKACCNG